MVIGEKFAWAHIPKTGGDSTHLLFRKIDDGHLRFIDGAEKHNSFQREGAVGLDRISNIRRLPSLLKSWALHFSHHSKWNPGNDDRPFTRDQLVHGQVWWLEPYTSDWKLVSIDQVVFDYYELDRIKHWIRTECLLDDFRKVISPYMDVSKLETDVHTNQAAEMGAYIRKIQFSKYELKQIYRNCRRLADIEATVYGDLIFTDEHYKEYLLYPLLDAKDRLKMLMGK